MLRLETLGSLVLAGDSGTPLPIQRRQLALLALLSTAGKRGVRRDKLVAYLWPDSPEPKAKHALEQLIYSLRQDQDETLTAGPDPLRINHHALEVDAVEFTAAVERGDHATAVGLYHGAFLDGFFLTGSPEFESWVAAERSRLAGMFRLALERLARGQAQAGDLDAAVESWRKLAAADPLSSSATIGLMRTLMARGNRPAAWQQGKEYESLIRRELGHEPDPELRALLAELAPGTPRS